MPAPRPAGSMVGDGRAGLGRSARRVGAGRGAACGREPGAGLRRPPHDGRAAPRHGWRRAGRPGGGGAAGSAQAAALPAAVSPEQACEGPLMLGVLRPGMAGGPVWEMRQQLHRLGFDAGDLDEERYDAALLAAVRAFQASRGLQPDGVVGPMTWAALAADDHVPAAAHTPPPPGEVSIFIDTERLTLTVYSDGQPYKTYPVAVGR